MCEDVLLAHQEEGFVTTILRPATVCGYAPRQRLDVIVNILTNNAYNKRLMTVIGGRQKDQISPLKIWLELTDMFYHLLQKKLKV